MQEPQKLLPEDEVRLRIIQEAYPYFSIAQLLSHFRQSGNIVNRDLLEMYGYNPVVYHYWKDALSWSAPAPMATVVNVAVEQPVAAPEELTFDLGAVDYFTKQGIAVSSDLPEIETATVAAKEEDTDKSLLVVMSFTEWLQFLQHKTHKEQEEEEEKRALKALWQKQKMAEAIEEENDEIPASVFEMAVNSISREEAVVSETMAIVYAKQGKIQEAIAIYKKLSLKNPEKSIYFAEKIESLQKEI
ncbi:hypothetical protein DBR32_00125 [Taibaiella sp. KBW10]|nr:hypothetical protein DBR32_00125 [Taibaiella sp. KBW10]